MNQLHVYDQNNYFVLPTKTFIVSYACKRVSGGICFLSFCFFKEEDINVKIIFESTNSNKERVTEDFSHLFGRM
jgi:hypothetical protein